MALTTGPFNWQVDRAGFQKMLDRDRIETSDSATSANQAGTLYVQDVFTPGLTPPDVAPAPTHGLQVARAARQQGFQGRLVANPVQMSAFQERPPEWSLFQPNLTKEQSLDAIRAYASTGAQRMANDQAESLDRLSAQGKTQSVVNVSLGVSQAGQVSDLYRLAFGPLGASKTAIHNYAIAFGLDEQKLSDPDPKIHSAERQRLVQSLLDQVGQAWESDPALAAARKRWDAAVDRFEAGHNSVVIAAGNEGDRLQSLVPGGPGLNIPANATTNILENQAVTSVGATRWWSRPDGPKEQLAAYSSRSPGVDIYATGSVGYRHSAALTNWGTSFAAPRVAATMATLHQRNPELSSAQIETLVKSLTHPLEGPNGPLQVLDYSKALQLMSEQTF